jgi:hypothetical protein
MQQTYVRKSDQGLLQLIHPEAGVYLVLFEDTPLRHLTTSVSMIALVFMYLTKKDMNWLVNTYRRNKKQ